MSETTESAPAPVAKTDLVTFCRRLSRHDRQVELIAAFAHVEKVAGRAHDTHENYKARYAAFAKSPS
jgi:hypothetical protein